VEVDVNAGYGGGDLTGDLARGQGHGMALYGTTRPDQTMNMATLLYMARTQWDPTGPLALL